MSTISNTVDDKLYHLLAHARNRCVNKNHSSYRNYGGRGVKFFPSLEGNVAKATAAVRATIGDRPTSNHQLDRYPDNDGDYEIGNIRWATRSENNLNRRTPTLRLRQKDEAILALQQQVAILTFLLYSMVKP